MICFSNSYDPPTCDAKESKAYQQFESLSDDLDDGPKKGGVDELYDDEAEGTRNHTDLILNQPIYHLRSV